MTIEIGESPGVGGLVWQQIRYQDKVFWRTPIAAFFTLAFPLMLLVLFGAIFGTEGAQFLAPNLAVFAAVSATYTNLAIGTAMARDNGLLKRIRGTPIPPWAYIAGRVLSGVYLAFIATTLMMGVGIAFYEITLNPEALPAVLLTFVVGVSCFAALGMLVAAISPSGEAAPAITNATLLPVAFISGVFIPMENPPTWMEVLGNFFPLKAFAVAFSAGFDPTLTGPQFHWPELAQLTAWGIAAGLLAARLFKWEPGSPSGRRRRRDGGGE